MYRNFLFLCALTSALAQQPVSIKVDAHKTVGNAPPIYAYFGYDEPNYTYTEHGRKLIHELAALSKSPVYIRTHFMLASGDGTAGLKWGSTNAYTEDESGKPVYDWTIVDRILGNLSRSWRQTVCRDRLHAESALDSPRSISTNVDSRRQERTVQHRLDVSAQRLR